MEGLGSMLGEWWNKPARVIAAGALLATAALGSSAATCAQSPAATGCTSSGTADTVQLPDTVEGKFNVAMVLIGPHDDGGWSQAHYEGLEYVCENVPDTHVAYVELVPEGADSEQVFRSLARKGFDFIIGTSFGYMDPMETVATDLSGLTVTSGS
jgi:basic membrane protein A